MVDSRMKESLSAMVDGEASELELHRLLKACEEGDQLRKSWRNYQLQGALLRRELSPDEAQFSSVDLSASIAQALALEKPLARRSKFKGAWLQNLGRIAVAASVAGAVVFGVQYQRAIDAPAAQDTLVSSAAPSGLPIGFGAPQVEARTVSNQSHAATSSPHQGVSVVASPEFEAYLNFLMLEHAEYAARNGTRGMLPFARVGQFDATPEPEVKH